MRDQKIRGLYEAYQSIYSQEKVEQIDEADSIAAMRARAAATRKQRYGKQGGGGRDDFRPLTPEDYERGEANHPRKKVKKEDETINASYEYDTFDTILEYLVAEGYADTNENALVIMANMSEEWKQSIVDEAYQEPKFNRKHYLQKLSKGGGMGMGTPEDPHGYRDPKMATVGAEFVARKTAAWKAQKTGEPDTYKTEREAKAAANKARGAAKRKR